MKCTDCGRKEFVAYNEETGLLCCADCGQFYQIKIKELEDLRRQWDELKSELENIANATPSEWEELSDQFQEWAQSRARFTLAKIKEAT